MDSVRGIPALLQRSCRLAALAILLFADVVSAEASRMPAASAAASAGSWSSLMDNAAPSPRSGHVAVSAVGAPVIGGQQGFPVQYFQRRVVQLDAGGQARLLNLFDAGLLPYHQFNGSTFPEADIGLLTASPDPGNEAATLAFVRAHAPDTFDGLPGNFYQRFLNTVTLQDAYPAGGERGTLTALLPGLTQAILLADYLKQIIQASGDLPHDLTLQAGASSLYAEYCPSAIDWLCRPDALQGADLTNAFQSG